MWFKKTMGVLVALMLLLAACQPSASESPSESGTAAASADLPPQVLRVDIGGEPPTLDPTQATDSASIQVLRSITHPLAYFDADLNIVPGLADWEISADGQTVTFTLKEGIAYSDGQPIVAGDFVYSWKRLIDPRNAAGYSYVLSYVEGGAELLGADPEVDDVDAMLDDLRCRGARRFDLRRPPCRAGRVLPVRRHPVGDGSAPRGHGLHARPRATSPLVR